MSDAYTCRGRARSVEIVEAFLSSNGSERKTEHRAATFDPAGELEREIVFSTAPGDSFERMDRLFQHGRCIAETAYKGGKIVGTRRMTFDSAGRLIEEIAEDSAGGAAGGRKITYEADGGRTEQMETGISGPFHYHVAGVHFPVANAASIRSIFNEKSLLVRVEFVSADGMVASQVTVHYDAKDRRRSVRHGSETLGASAISETRFEYDDAAGTMTRVVEVLGEIVERRTESQVHESSPPDEIVYEEQLNDAGDWIERVALAREGERLLPRSVVRRTISYW